MNILITGGSAGLGKATVQLLSEESEHNIWFTYHNENNISLINEMLKSISNIHPIRVNFCDTESVNSLCEKIKTIDLDVLINSTYVGAPRTTHFHKIGIDEFVDSFQNNLIPTIKITQTAINIFKKKRFGKIINVLTSYLIGLPPMGVSTYAANKAYLMELSKVWNKEYARYNITSNCLSPEFMQTNFASVDERIVEQMIKDHPLKKLLTVEEVATSIKYLIDAPQQVNGVNLVINAGQVVV